MGRGDAVTRPLKPEARTLIAWALLLGPPSAWFAHFGFVYAVASIGIVASGEAGAVPRIVIAIGTLGALVAVVTMALLARRFAPDPQPARRFWPPLVRILALVSAIGIVYQALPALIVP